MAEREAFQEDVKAYKRHLYNSGERFHHLLLHNRRDVEWRSIVISGDNFNSFQLLPWQLINLEDDEEGRAECDGSKCGKATPHNVTMLCQKRQVTRSQIDSVQVQGWGLASKADVDAAYDYCGATEEFFDAFRQFLVKSTQDVAVVFHSASDPCSLCRGSHYHVIVSRDNRQSLDADYNWKRLRAVISRARGCGGLTANSQRVRTIVNLVGYLSTPPRVWMGTNSPTLMAIRQYRLEEAAKQAEALKKRQREEEEERDRKRKKRPRVLVSVPSEAELRMAALRREQRLEDMARTARIVEEANRNITQEGEWDDDGLDGHLE